MGGLEPAGLDPGYHRLEALAVTRQQQASAAAPNRGDAVGVPDRIAERLNVKPQFVVARWR